MVIPYLMASTKKEIELDSICGYDAAFFIEKRKVLYATRDCIKIRDLDNHYLPIAKIALKGPITALATSPNFSTFAISTAEPSNPKLFIFTSSLLVEKHTFGLKNSCNQIAISQGGEASLALSSNSDSICLTCYDLTEGKISATGSIYVEQIPDTWQLSFCPADESVCCAFGGEVAYLLRCNNGYIENFSSISLPNSLCHGWSNDVTMVFGNSDGQLKLYRETIALQTIEMKHLVERVLQAPVDKVCVLALQMGRNKFSLLLNSGLILLFKNNSNGPMWEDCTIIVQESFQESKQYFLHFDDTDEFLLYSNGRQLMCSSLRRCEIVQSSCGTVVAVKHNYPVSTICTSHNRTVCLDVSGCISIISRITGKPLLCGAVEGANTIACIPKSDNLWIGTKDSLSKYLVTMDGLIPTENHFKGTISNLSISSDTLKVAITSGPKLLVFTAWDSSVTTEANIASKKEIIKMTFYDNNKFLLLLNSSDSITAIDLSNSKTLWTVDFKLKFLTDIAVANDIVYLLDERFIIRRLKHGKELLHWNLHAAALPFSNKPKFLAVSNDSLYVATNEGSIVSAPFNTMDQPVVILTSTCNNVSYFTCDRDDLFIAYADGGVSCSSLRLSNISGEDFITCHYQTVCNMRTVIKDLDYEKTQLRKDTEQFMKDYTEKRNLETATLRLEYTTTMQRLADRVKNIESAFELSEEDKIATISGLRNLYQEESEQKHLSYEKELNELVRNLMLADEKLQAEKKQHIWSLEQKENEIKNNFKLTEKILLCQIQSLKKDNMHLENQISDLFLHLTTEKNKAEIFAKQYEKEKQTVHELRADERKQLEKEIWNLRATCVQLTEQRDKISNNFVSKSEMNKTLEEKLESCKSNCAQLEKNIEQLRLVLSKRQINETTLKKDLNKMKQKHIDAEQQAIESKRKETLLRKRCDEMERRIEELGRNVYDKRKLEHSTLSLLAFMQNINADRQFSLS